MKYRKDLKFARIIRNKEINHKVINIFKNAYFLNKKIFKKEPKKFRIFICDNEEEIKKKSKNFYQKWGTAYVMGNKDLIIRSPEFVRKIGLWKPKDYSNIVMHEINHVFYQSIYGSWKPIWLAEGVGCYVGKNFILPKRELKKLIKEYDVNYALLDHRYLRRKFKHGHYPRYPIWANFTKYIISKYSFNKLVNILNKYSKNPNKKNYHKLFKKILGLSDRRLFNEFLESVKM